MHSLSKRLNEFMQCWGDQCFNPPPHPTPLPPPPPLPGFNATLVYENLCANCGSCTEKALLRLEEQSPANCAEFKLGLDVTREHNQIQVSSTMLCWNIEDAHCYDGQTIYMHSCWSAGGARKADEFVFDPEQRLIRSQLCIGMCATKAGGPPASPAIVLGACNSSAAIGWTTAMAL